MAFRLTLALHTPVLLPMVPIRLDTLLHEAACRLNQDWAQAHELPLVFDSDIGGWRASQLYFVTTPTAPLATRKLTTVSSFDRLDRVQVRNAKMRFRAIGGYQPRLTEYACLSSPFVRFYGDGDADACVALLELLDGIGRNHNRGGGQFSVSEIADDDTAGWRWRSWPAETTVELPFTEVGALERLAPGGVDVAVRRPARVLRETMT